MESTIGQMLATAARRFGDKPLVVAVDRTLTFEQLDRLSTQFAQQLHALGIQPGDRITLWVENGWRWMVAYYGISKLGAIANPCNIQLTADEVVFIVNDCGAKAVIAASGKAGGVSDRITALLITDTAAAGVPDNRSVDSLLAASTDGPSAGSLPIWTDGGSTSTIGYTSGTTGHPKGAMLRHSTIVMNTAMTALMHGRTSSDVVVSALPCTHVYGNVVMNAAVLCGMTLVLLPRFDEAEVLKAIQEHRATMFEGVPTMFMRMLNLPSFDTYDVSSLRLCTVGGQTMPVTKMEEVERRFGCPLIELWGMTELGGLGTTHPHNGPRRLGSIGVALPLSEAKVVAVDDPAVELPRGEVGELMLRGPLVMEGYFGNEAATRATIEPDGLDDDGYFHVVDRAKEVIISGGYNIYPAELERIIAQHPAVAMVAVAAMHDELKGQVPKAFVVPKAGVHCADGEIIEHCRARLASYKVPREVVFLDDLPKTSTGKILRRGAQGIRHRLRELRARPGGIHQLAEHHSEQDSAHERCGKSSMSCDDWYIDQHHHVGGNAMAFRHIEDGRTQRICLSLLLTGISALPIAAPVCAQSAIEGQSNVLEEIVVTAAKRSESVQDVPISITAFTGDQLEERQIQSAFDLAGTVPNLAVNHPSGDQQAIFSIRGISSSDVSLGQNGPVAIYHDEVYKGTSPLQGVALLFDLERVEVLKGPQGTLYGKNTTGGAINFVSRVPDFSTRANASVRYGNYDQFHVDGGAQTAISDKLAGRLAFTWNDADGWQTNTAPGEPDTSSTDNYAVRGTLLFEPTDSFSTILRASTSRSTPLVSGGAFVPFVPQGVGFPSYPAVGAGGVLLEPEMPTNLREAYVESPRRHSARTASISATANLKLSSDLDLTSITSWDHGSQRMPFDGWTRIKILKQVTHADVKQVAQDVRLTSHFTGAFNFIVGAYYNREHVEAGGSNEFLLDIDVNQDGIVNAADCIDGGFFAACRVQSQYQQLKKSTAVYADASYALSDKFTMRSGLRYTHDQGDLYDYTSNIGDLNGNDLLNTIPGAPGGTASLDFSGENLSGRLGLDYNISSDALLYASYNRGYRAAAFNNTAFFSPKDLNVARPEEVSSYEIGFKTEFFSRRVRFNGAAFYMDYTNQQVKSFDPVTLSTNLINLGASEVKGGEVELTVRATEGLNLFSMLGIVDAKAVRGVANGVDVSGRNLQIAPDITASAGFELEGTLRKKLRYAVRVDGIYTGKQYFDLSNDPIRTQGGYTLINGRIRFSGLDDRVGFSIWGKNLTDKLIYTTMNRADFVGAKFVTFNAPRMYGVSLDVEF